MCTDLDAPFKQPTRYRYSYRYPGTGTFPHHREWCTSVGAVRAKMRVKKREILVTVGTLLLPLN